MIGTIYVLVLLVIVFIYPSAALACSCYKSCMRKKKLSVGEMLLCWIPFVNLHVIRKSFYGTAKAVDAGLAVIGGCIAIRAVALFFLYSNEWFMVISSFVMIGCILFTWLLSGYVYYDTAVCVNQGSFIKLFCWVIPPLGAFIVSKAVAPFMKSMKEELDGTFSQPN